MKLRVVQFGLSLFVVLGIGGRLLAQQAMPIASAKDAPSQIVQMQLVPSQEPPLLESSCAACAAKGSPNAGPNGAANGTRRHNLRGLFQSHGYICHTDDDLLCSSPSQDFRFIFGSCRSFFGQPCLPEPPHAPHR